MFGLKFPPSPSTITPNFISYMQHTVKHTNKQSSKETYMQAHSHTTSNPSSRTICPLHTLEYVGYTPAQHVLTAAA
jgi:hypothetical protein